MPIIVAGGGGGTAKGLEVVGDGAGHVLKVSPDGTVAFFGAQPAAQPAAPATLADVIAALTTLGLVAKQKGR